VWLAFTVAPNGVLERIHVARGSGYDALDNAAIVALRRVEQMQEASAWLDGHALAMELPVIYRLQEP
jgi:TonB family protein